MSQPAQQRNLGRMSEIAQVAVRHGFGNREFDREGRYVEADVDLGDGRPGLRVASLYLPKGGVPETSADGHARFARKMRFKARRGLKLSTRMRTGTQAEQASQ